MTNKTSKDFYEKLGEMESSGRYDNENSLRFVGKYQMGEAALKDLGYYNESSNPNYYNNDWRGSFSGKNGINSLEDFKNNKEVQEQIIREYHKLLWERLKSKGADKYVGAEINGTVVTPSGMIAAAHLKGDSFVIDYLKNNGNVQNSKDGYGTDVQKYLKMSGYNIEDVLGHKKSDNIQPIKNNGNQEYKKLFPLMHSLQNSFPTGYAASINDVFYATEDIDKMSTEEFLNAEDIINNQIKNKIAVPKAEAQAGVQNGLYIYVDDYVRDDGTKVRGYYRHR